MSQTNEIKETKKKLEEIWCERILKNHADGNTTEAVEGIDEYFVELPSDQDMLLKEFYSEDRLRYWGLVEYYCNHLGEGIHPEIHISEWVGNLIAQGKGQDELKRALNKLSVNLEEIVEKIGKYDSLEDVSTLKGKVGYKVWELSESGSLGEDVAFRYATIADSLLEQCFRERDFAVVKCVQGFEERGYTEEKRKAIDDIVGAFERDIKGVFEFIDRMPYWLKGIQADDRNQYLDFVQEISQLNYKAAIKFGHIAADIKDKDTIEEYAKGVEFLLKKSRAKEELQIEGLLAAILDPTNTQLIKESFTNPIFRYILYQTTRKLPIDDPSLWVYGSDAESEERCAKAQLDAIGYKHFELEKKLILEKMREVLDTVIPKKAKDFYYVDIGVGDGKKTLEVIKSARDQGLSVNCGLVEPNHEMLGIAKKTIEDDSNGNNIHKFPVKIEDLGNLEFKKFRSGRPVLFSFFGTTFCNFNPDDITQALYDVMERGDYILIGVYLYQEGIKGIDDKINTAYRTDAIKDFSARPLINLGVSEQDLEDRFEYSMELRKKQDFELGTLVTRVITSYTYTGEEPLEVGLVTFRKGDEVPGILSIKYTDEQMRKILERNKLTQVNTFREGDVALYLAKK